MRKLLEDSGLSEVEVDSAGTHDYHVGEPPDPRAVAVAKRRGYDLSSLRARKVMPADFEAFDLILAMDFNNFGVLQALCPMRYRARLDMLMSYAREHTAIIVQDPYYRGTSDFAHVLDYIEDACRGLVEVLAKRNQAVGQAG